MYQKVNDSFKADLDFPLILQLLGFKNLLMKNEFN